MYKHLQWTTFFKRFRTPTTKNLHTAISVNKPKLSVTKHDQTLILAHMSDTNRYTANTKMYSRILHTHTKKNTGGARGGGGAINYRQI